MMLLRFLAPLLSFLACLTAAAEIGALSPGASLEYDIILTTHKEVLAAANQPLAKLGAGYTAALQKRKAAAQSAGQLDQVTAAESALKSFSDGTPPSAESADPEIAKLAKVYLAEQAKLTASLKTPQAAAWKKHRTNLESFVVRLTKEGKTDDAITVREEIAAVTGTIAGLEGKADPAKPEIPAGWVGEWELKYDNNETRRLQITMDDPKILNIHVVSGSWEPGVTFTATLDPARGCYVAAHAEAPGRPQRTESYLLQGKRLMVRHWHDEFTYEKPELKGIARKPSE